MTLVGFLRGDTMNVYAGAHRLKLAGRGKPPVRLSASSVGGYGSRVPSRSRRIRDGADQRASPALPSSPRCVGRHRGAGAAEPSPGLPAWDRVPTPNIGTGDNQLYGVDALAPDDIWAVGYSTEDLRDEPLVEHFDGSTWSIVPTPDIGDSETGAQLLAVDAMAPDDVWAVGGYGNQFSLIMHWDGSEWSAGRAPQPGPAPAPVQRVRGRAGRRVGGRLPHQRRRRAGRTSCTGTARVGRRSTSPNGSRDTTSCSAST